MIVVDDLHWADRGTGQLLRHLIDAIGSSAVVLAVTYRDTEPDGDVDLTQLVSQLRRLGNVDRLALTGLGVDELRCCSRRPATAPMSISLKTFVSGPEAMLSLAAEVLLTFDGSGGAGPAFRRFPMRSMTW